MGFDISSHTFVIRSAPAAYMRAHFATVIQFVFSQTVEEDFPDFTMWKYIGGTRRLPGPC